MVTENHGCHQLSQDHPLEIGHEITNQINQINQIKTRSTRSTRSATEEKHGFQLIFVVKSLESACEDDSFSFTVGMFNRHLCLHDIKVINCWVLIMIWIYMWVWWKNGFVQTNMVSQKWPKSKEKTQKEKSLTRLSCLVILGCQTRHADEFVVGDLIPISSSDSSEISESCRPWKSRSKASIRIGASRSWGAGSTSSLKTPQQSPGSLPQHRPWGIVDSFLWCRWGLFPPATALSNICLPPAHSPHKHRQRQIRTSLDVEALWAVLAEIAPRHSPADPPQKNSLDPYGTRVFTYPTIL